MHTATETSCSFICFSLPTARNELSQCQSCSDSTSTSGYAIVDATECAEDSENLRFNRLPPVPILGDAPQQLGEDAAPVSVSRVGVPGVSTAGLASSDPTVLQLPTTLAMFDAAVVFLMVAGRLVDLLGGFAGFFFTTFELSTAAIHSDSDLFSNFFAALFFAFGLLRSGAPPWPLPQ